MSYSGTTRGDFFSRTSKLVHLFDQNKEPHNPSEYYSSDFSQNARLIDEQVRLGARSFLWIVSGSVSLPSGQYVRIVGEYRGEDGNYVPAIESTVYGSGVLVENNLSLASVVPLSHWRLERERVFKSEDFFIRLRGVFSSANVDNDSHADMNSLAIFGGYFEEPYRAIL